MREALALSLFALLPGCTPEIPTASIDADGDGWGSREDCDDANPLVHPGADEICRDLIDNDCDGEDSLCLPLGDALLEASDLTITGLPGSNAGYVRRAGDIDGDGVDDLAVSAPGSPDGGPVDAFPSTVFLFLGPLEAGTLSVLDADAAIRTGSDHPVHIEVATAGDLDADGLDDLVLTYPGAGQVFVLHGPLSGDLTLEDAVSISWDEPADTTRVFAGADLTDDGVPDLIVSEPGGADPFPGRVVVLPGPVLAGAEYAASPILVEGSAADERFGDAVTVGDFDGDGRGDLAVGSPWSRGWRQGSVYIFSGPVLADTTSADASAHLPGGVDLTLLGISLRPVSVTGQGAQDLLVGAGGLGDGLGGVLRYAAPFDGTIERVDASTLVQGLQPEDRTGSDFTPLDLNGDGAVDLAISSPGTRDPESPETELGSVEVVYGPDLASPGDADARLWGPVGANGAALGAVEALDVNGDGVDDLVVGAPRYSDTALFEGRTFVLFGQEGTPGRAP